MIFTKAIQRRQGLALAFCLMIIFPSHTAAARSQLRATYFRNHAHHDHDHDHEEHIARASRDLLPYILSAIFFPAVAGAEYRHKARLQQFPPGHMVGSGLIIITVGADAEYVVQ